MRVRALVMTVEDEIIVVSSLLELKTRCVPVDNFCAVCKISRSPYWRTDQAGRMLCNACGIYHKRNHVDRPVNLWKKPKRRPKF